MRGYSIWACALTIGLAGGCGGTTPSEGTTTDRDKASAMDAFGITGPDVPWAEMGEADKEFYMVGKVNPIFQEMFGRHDAERYSSFSCEQCHGKEMRELHFKMPALSMYIVPPEGTPGFKGMQATFPETVAFMRDSVTPAMGKLLGVENEVTCWTCHPSAAPVQPMKKKRWKRKRK